MRPVGILKWTANPGRSRLSRGLATVSYFLTGAGAAGIDVAAGVPVVFGATFFTCFLVFFEVAAGLAGAVELAGVGT